MLKTQIGGKTIYNYSNNEKLKENKCLQVLD